jgi:hypothetical protein
MTGGNVADVAETRAALGRVAAQRTPDVGAALALACHRDQCGCGGRGRPAHCPPWPGPGPYIAHSALNHDRTRSAKIPDLSLER